MGGFNLVVFPYKKFTAGNTEILNYPSPTQIYLAAGEGITEAFGRYGEVIDQLTFRVTPLDPHANPRQYTVGGPNGGAFDATPRADITGPCDLVSISGQTTTNFGNFIGALEFKWSCIGKPSHYTY